VEPLHRSPPSWVHLYLQRLPEEGREPMGIVIAILAVIGIVAVVLWLVRRA
jgi:hypothetical protein